MMTLLQVLPPDKYGEIMGFVKGTDVQPPPSEPSIAALSLQMLGTGID
jgi:hypothetical protein